MLYDGSHFIAHLPITHWSAMVGVRPVASITRGREINRHAAFSDDLVGKKLETIVHSGAI